MQKGTRTASWLGDRSDQFDLRRTRDDRTADRVVSRAEWLPEPERSLILSVFRDGTPVATLARVREGDPRTLRRRVARAASRLLDDRAAFVALRMHAWPPPRQRVARAIFHHGVSLRQAARDTGLTLHAVRTHRDAILGLFEAESARHAKGSGVDRSWR